MTREKRLWRKIVGIVAILIVVATLAWLAGAGPDVAGSPPRAMPAGAGSGVPPSSTGSAASSTGPGADELVPQVVYPEKFDLSPPLRDIPPAPPRDRELRPEIDVPLPGRGTWGTIGRSDDLDTGLQDWHGSIHMDPPLQNFEGIANVDNASGVMPPDTQGDVGPNHYVQMVNNSFAVYDKSGNLLLGPTDNDTLWSGMGNLCETNGMGDPITIYDHLADRWFMSQFAFKVRGLGTPTDPYYQCIAVSQTSDPTGAWYRYAWEWPGDKMNDYPHFGLWPDGYYLTVNQFSCSGFGCSWSGAGVAAFERDQMLLGNTAQMIYFDLYSVNENYGGQLPADLEGTAPPAGSPNYILQWDDSTWMGDPEDTTRVWECSVDWVTPDNSTLGINGDPNYVMATNDVDPDICDADREKCIDQPGTSVMLEAISDRLMYRVQYRNFGTHEAMVTNHTVDADGNGHAGIHWFELRDEGTGWGIHQHGTYAPDTNHRWMGSIAMDHEGNMGLGFSVSSSSVYPSIRYVGRLAGDPLGTFPQGETTLIAGSGSQTYSAARWGDYSTLTVDSTNGCTFWYTQEYMEYTDDWDWQTRIGSFAHADCTPTAVKLLSFGASPTADGVLLTWETASELDNLGFNLYRSTARQAIGTQLNNRLIPSQSPGQGMGASYQFLDGTAHPGATYYYTLEDIDEGGRRAQHGPLELTLWRAYLPLVQR